VRGLNNFRLTILVVVILAIGLLPHTTTIYAQTVSNHQLGFGELLAEAAFSRTKLTIRYDGSYHRLSYPGGDVPADIGVCTDVVIRTYRTLGFDLQVLVHEDMMAHFSEYPTIWQNTKPDHNIDHRRVPNLQSFFARKGQEMPVSQRSVDYLPGDLVTWMVGRNLPHIGIVSNQQSADGKRYLIIHNIGSGPKLEDCLFDFKITGHYRYHPAH
jgi:uncharacterized protein